MNIFKLDDHVAVAPQISPQNVAQIAAEGYRVLINNRPDGEVPGQPTSAEIAAAAEAAGMEYHYLPVTAANFPGPDMARISSLMNDSDRPVLAFCRSGTRCANLWVASRTADDNDRARARALAMGFDLGMANTVC